MLGPCSHKRCKPGNHSATLAPEHPCTLHGANSKCLGGSESTQSQSSMVTYLMHGIGKKRWALFGVVACPHKGRKRHAGPCQEEMMEHKDRKFHGRQNRCLQQADTHTSTGYSYFWTALTRAIFFRPQTRIGANSHPMC